MRARALLKKGKRHRGEVGVFNTHTPHRYCGQNDEKPTETKKRRNVDMSLFLLNEFSNII